MVSIPIRHIQNDSGWCVIGMKKTNVSSHFLQMPSTFLSFKLPICTKTDGRLNCSSNGSSSTFESKNSGVHLKMQSRFRSILPSRLTIMQHDMQLDRSTYEVLQILGISLMAKTPLRDLFSKTKFNNVKDQSGLYEPDLFENFNSSLIFSGH